VNQNGSTTILANTRTTWLSQRTGPVGWTIYVNGQVEVSGTDGTAPGSGFTIGVYFVPATGGFFPGRIDEVRISDTPRSAAWIAAQYKSMNDTFVTFGPEAAHCCGLGVTETATTITVNGPNRFDIRFNTATGGGIDRFVDAEENTGVDLAAGNPVGVQQALFTDEVDYYTTGTNVLGTELHLLEATAARVRVRQAAFYDDGTPAILPGFRS
jgi:hypothetical protein